jgi:hypothetical protein
MEKHGGEVKVLKITKGLKNCKDCINNMGFSKEMMAQASDT